jgi:Sulfotransferase family
VRGERDRGPGGTGAVRGRLPTFVVLGAAKAGTTSLYHYLRRHPQVFMSERKELDFFVEEQNWGLGTGWYREQFAGAGDALAVGEATPRYTAAPKHEGVPGRMASVVPEARLVYLVRDPVERMRSHYQQLVRRGLERRPVEEALLAHPPYVDQSRYAMQIERYLEHFPRERLLVVLSERLRSRRTEALGEILAFLGVDPTVSNQQAEGEFHRADDKRVPRPLIGGLRRVPGSRRLAAALPERMRRAARGMVDRPLEVPPAEVTPELRARLEELLRDDVRALRAYLGPDFDGWGIA